MLFTDEPTTWVDPPPTTLLHTLLLFVGVPLLITAVIALLVMLPTLAKGQRYSPGQPWDAEPAWFGSPEAVAELPAGSDSGPGRPQLTGSTRAPAPDADTDTGGASVRW